MAGAGANPAGTGEQLLMRLLQTQQEQMGQLQALLERSQGPRGSVVDTKAIGRPEKLGLTCLAPMALQVGALAHEPIPGHTCYPDLGSDPR